MNVLNSRATKVAAAILCMAISSTTLCGKTIKGESGYIAFEAESPTKSVNGGWVVRAKGDKEYNQITGDTSASNNAYIEYVEGVNDGLGVKSGVDVLTYTFTPKTSGTYYLSGRMAQQRQQPNGEAAWDQCNDIFIKMEGDFKAPDSVPFEILNGWNKFYGRGFNSWGSFMNIDVNHAKYVPAYILEKGKKYTLSISSRSRGVCIDYFLLTQTPLKLQEKLDLVKVNSAKPSK